MTGGSIARRAVGALLLGGVVLAASPVVAHADVASDGLWYFDALKVQDAHDAGFTGDGITVAVLDSAINLEIPTLRDAAVQLGDQPECFLDGHPVPAETTDYAQAVHGTNVASMIAGTGAESGVKGVAPGATVLYYRVTPGGDQPCQDADGDENYAVIAEAIDAAVDSGARVISISLAFGPGSGIREAITRALARQVIVVTALSNQDELIGSAAWSGYLNGGVSVQALDKTGAVATHESPLGGTQPNTDPDVDVAAPGVDILIQGTADAGFAGQTLESGTSLATPIVAGFLAVTAQKYPEATGNQLLQSLIHNTGTGDHPLEYDPNQMFGYGFVSLTSMLRADPAQYPDVNPFVIPDGEPTAAEIAAAVPPTPTATPDDPGAGAPAEGFSLPVIVGGVVGLMVVGAAVVVVILIARSRRGRT